MKTCFTGSPWEGKSAVALGNFDGVHLGHRALAKKCAELAKERGLCSVIYTFDTHPANVLAGRTVTPEITDTAEKRRRLRACGANFLYIERFDEAFAALTPEEFFYKVLIGRLKASYILCGETHRFGRGAAGKTEELKRLCDESKTGLYILPSVEYEGVPVSSSRIRELLLKGDVSLAAKLMGAPFSLTARVERGNGIGRGLGFPTINQRFSTHALVPLYGVYSSRTRMDGKWYKSVSNVGVHPTVGKGEPALETHIIGCDGLFYGKTLRVELLRRLRDEIRFESREQLSAQIAKDLRDA